MLLAYHAVVFQDETLGGANMIPLKTSAWEATILLALLHFVQL